MSDSKLRSHWVCAVRTNGEAYCHLADDAPQWLKDAVHEAHQTDLPNDWIYNECRAACDAIDDERLQDEDGMHGHCDGRVDVYTKVLYRWAADMCLSDTWACAEENAEEMGDEGTMVDRLMRIQLCAIESIASTILHAWQESGQVLSDDDSEGGES
jgi:hypothetical protein